MAALGELCRLQVREPVDYDDSGGRVPADRDSGGHTAVPVFRAVSG
jgi:hypothetical protein